MARDGPIACAEPMAFNPHSDQHLSRLQESLVSSRDEMETARKHRLRSYKELVGKNYSDGGTGTARPLNQIELASTIYKQSLISISPRGLVTPRHSSLTPEAASFEAALNTVLSDDGISGELETAVAEAMFSPLGKVKISLDLQDAVDIDGTQIWTGPPRIKAVTFDNQVVDMSAGGPHSVSYEGDRYYVDYEWAMNSGIYDPDLLAKLKPAGEQRQDQYDSRNVTREKSFYEDYRDLVEVWDVWMPDDGLLLTYGPGFENKQPLRTTEWDGPASGPYQKFWFGMVPGNSLPLPPVALWLDLNEMANRLWNKLGRQADRQKVNGAVESSDAADGVKLRDAKDGDYLTLNRLGNFQEIRAGGIDNLNFAFVLQVLREFSRQAGNLDSLGGLAPMSGTLGQDKLLSEGASQRLGQMQARVRDWLRRVFRTLGGYMWQNALLDVAYTRQTDHGPVSGTWNQQSMTGEFPDYLIDIDPYSLQDRSPTERLMQLTSFWQNDVLPTAPFLAAAGYAPDFANYVRLCAKYMDLPELPSLLMQIQPGQPLEAPAPGGKPSITTRQVVRNNRSLKTRDGELDTMVQSLLSGGNSMNPVGAE